MFNRLRPYLQTRPLIDRRSQHLRCASTGMQFDVLFEVVEDSLPSVALLFDRIRCLRIEGFTYRDAIVALE